MQVSQSFVNTGSRQMEVSFVFPLPYDGAIDQLTLLVDGKEYDAKLLDAKEARRQYEAIVRKNQDPALLEWMGTGMFKTSVFPVPPGAERKVTLRYSQLCRKIDGLTDFLFPLSTAKYTSHPVEKLDVQRRDRKPRRDQERLQPDARGRDQAARQQARHVKLRRAKNEVPTSDFRLLYDVGDGQARRERAQLPARRRATTAIFLLLASPEIKAANDERPEEDGDLRRRSLGQHERQEDRAGQGRRSSSCSTTCARATRSTSSPTTATVESFQARAAKVRRRNAQGGARLRRRPVRRRQHEHRRRR